MNRKRGETIRPFSGSVVVPTLHVDMWPTLCIIIHVLVVKSSSYINISNEI